MIDMDFNLFCPWGISTLDFHLESFVEMAHMYS